MPRLQPEEVRLLAVAARDLAGLRAHPGVPGLRRTVGEALNAFASGPTEVTVDLVSRFLNGQSGDFWRVHEALPADASFAVEATAYQKGSGEERPDEAAGRVHLLDAAAIFAPLPPVPWVCQALDIAPGAPTLLAGYGYSGKTLAAQDFALATASGGLAWGAFPVRPGRVLHLDYEQGQYLTRLRYQRLARARGIDPRDLAGRLVVAPLPEQYLDGDSAPEMLRLCEGFQVVIVDSLRAACPAIDENTSEARVPLDAMARVSERTGVAPLALHHARKPIKEAVGGARMSIRGSGAFYDACGSVLVFGASKGEPIAVQHEKARITGRTHPDFRLQIEDVDIGEELGAGLRVTALLQAPGEAGSAPEPDRFAALKGRILDLLRQEGPLTGGANLLRVRLGARKDDVTAALADLEARGSVQRSGTYHRPTLSASGTDRVHV